MKVNVLSTKCIDKYSSISVDITGKFIIITFSSVQDQSIYLIKDNEGSDICIRLNLDVTKTY